MRTTPTWRNHYKPLHYWFLAFRRCISTCCFNDALLTVGIVLMLLILNQKNQIDMKSLISVLVTSTTLVLFSIGAQAQSRHMERRGQNPAIEQSNYDINANDQVAQNNAPYIQDQQYGQSRQQNNAYNNYDQNRYEDLGNNEYGRGNNYERFDRYDRNNRYDRFSRSRRFHERRRACSAYEDRGSSCTQYNRGRY